MATEGTTIKTPTCVWQINVDRLKGKENKNEIFSPSFFTSNAVGCENEWRLEMSPKGFKPEDRGYLSLFLRNLGKSPITAFYNFFVLNNKYDAVKGAEFSGNDIFNNEAVGTRRFIKESVIMNPKNEFLKDNKLLTIVCNVIIVNKRSMVIDDTENSQQTKRIKLLDEYEEFFNNIQHSDVTIISESKKFYLSKIVLKAHSTVLRAMITNMEEHNLVALVIKDVKSEVLNELFQFIYTGKVDPTDKLCGDLLEAAQKYNIQGLKELCEERMSNYLSKNNVMSYLTLAVTNNAQKLKSAAIEYICVCSEDFCDDPIFCNIGHQHPEILSESFKVLSSLKLKS